MSNLEIENGSLDYSWITCKSNGEPPVIWVQNVQAVQAVQNVWNHWNFWNNWNQ